MSDNAYSIQKMTANTQHCLVEDLVISSLMNSPEIFMFLEIFTLLSVSEYLALKHVFQSPNLLSRYELATKAGAFQHTGQNMVKRTKFWMPSWKEYGKMMVECCRMGERGVAENAVLWVVVRGNGDAQTFGKRFKVLVIRHHKCLEMQCTEQSEK